MGVVRYSFHIDVFLVCSPPPPSPLSLWGGEGRVGRCKHATPHSASCMIFFHPSSTSDRQKRVPPPSMLYCHPAIRVALSKPHCLIPHRTWSYGLNRWVTMRGRSSLIASRLGDYRAERLGTRVTSPTEAMVSPFFHRPEATDDTSASVTASIEDG